MLTSLLYEMCVTKNHEQVSIGIRLITLIVGPSALLYVTSPYFYFLFFFSKLTYLINFFKIGR